MDNHKHNIRITVALLTPATDFSPLIADNTLCGSLLGVPAIGLVAAMLPGRCCQRVSVEFDCRGRFCNCIAISSERTLPIRTFIISVQRPTVYQQ